ncbi:MAG: MarR family transcriptional regulator [Hyphomicrobiales bacterium]|nr:MarR family transcriptional regulator [Hyphomicrobiales bacterium]
MCRAGCRTVPSRPEPYRLEAQIGHLLRRAHQRHVAIFIAEIGADGPTPTQFAALVKLGESEELSQNHLGRLTGMDPATTKGVVTRLIERGFIERAQDPTDQRRVKLRLSGEGSALVARLIERARAATAATLAPLSSSEQHRLVSLLERII